MQPSDPNYWNQGEDAPAPQVESGTPDPSPLPEPSVISWQASEHLQHNNGAGWYLSFFFIAVVLILFAVFFGAWTFIPVIIVMVIAGLIYVRRPPRTLHYAISDEGFEIDGTLHPYSTYKSFSVIRDGAFYAILLVPVRRFAPSTVVYFDEADGEAIVDAFGTHLPMENRDLDTLERFLRLIRF